MAVETCSSAANCPALWDPSAIRRTVSRNRISMCLARSYGMKPCSLRFLAQAVFPMQLRVINHRLSEVYQKPINLHNHQ